MEIKVQNSFPRSSNSTCNNSNLCNWTSYIQISRI